MLRRTGTFLALFALLAVPVLAAFLAEKIDEGIYFVSYERGKLTSGGMLDTAKKARKKITKRSHKFCLEEGYKYLKFPTLGEIVKDEELRAVWQIAAGDEELDSSETSGNVWQGTVRTHKARRLLLLSKEPQEGYEKCLAKP